MDQFLEKIRQKPPHYRTIFSFVVAGIITLGIFLLWFFLYESPEKNGPSIFEGISQFFSSQTEEAPSFDIVVDVESETATSTTATTTPLEEEKVSYPGLFGAPKEQ